MLTNEKELEILNGILNFKIKEIPDSTRFWMVRTQKGYFYEEFLARKFVAIAWNNIDQNTDFSESAKDHLKDDIVLNFPEIQRPSTVINKCNNFIYEINSGDILIIPSKGSQYITFAIAGEYFEDGTKTLELENAVIKRIKNNDVDIHDVSCPYKKRRRITILRTISSDDVNITLYRAISNYHGISSLDKYSYHILNELYNCYTFQDYTVLVYNIRKSGPITPRELSKLIYGNTECLCSIASEENLSTQMELHSPGDAIYYLKAGYHVIKDNWPTILGLLVFLGGGSALSFKVTGLIDIIKNVITLPQELRSKKLENDMKEIDLQTKRLELQQKIKDSGINPESLLAPLEAIVESTTSLQVEPINLNDNQPAICPSSSENENEESNDTDEE